MIDLLSRVFFGLAFFNFLARCAGGPGLLALLSLILHSHVKDPLCLSGRHGFKQTQIAKICKSNVLYYTYLVVSLRSAALKSFLHNDYEEPRNREWTASPPNISEFFSVSTFPKFVVSHKQNCLKKFMRNNQILKCVSLALPTQKCFRHPCNGHI